MKVQKYYSVVSGHNTATYYIKGSQLGVSFFLPLCPNITFVLQSRNPKYLSIL